jgi:DNA (cytosine-5)-methyltransferase 1
VRVLSLFSGIGGMDLGLERAGMKVVYHSEIDPYACRVLKKHWPDVPNLGDVKLIKWKELDHVDVIAGGYPCQPFSTAGKRKGKEDPRHLWPYVFDAIRELRPRYALMENVRGHLTLGFGDVLADLASCGYSAEWQIIPASSLGAPHRRDRLFFVAYPDRERSHRTEVNADEAGKPSFSDAPRRGEEVAYADGSSATERRKRPLTQGESSRGRDDGRRSGSDSWEVGIRGTREDSRTMAYPDGRRLEEREPEAESASGTSSCGELFALADTDGFLVGIDGSSTDSRSASRRGNHNRRGETRHDGGEWWKAEPDVGRVAHGVPARVDRLRGLGNAVVPQVAEFVGRKIMEFEARQVQ